MSALDEDRKLKQDGVRWRRLLAELNLPPETRCETIAQAVRDYRLIADGAEAEINRLRAELAEARAGYLVPAFLQPDLPERVT